MRSIADRLETVRGIARSPGSYRYKTDLRYHGGRPNVAPLGTFRCEIERLQTGPRTSGYYPETVWVDEDGSGKPLGV